MSKKRKLRYEVSVKYHGRWGLVAICLSEDDARLVAHDRALDTGTLRGRREVTAAKIERGGELLYMVEGA